MFRLGMEIQCPICERHSWYSIKEADYVLECPKCTEKFQIPSNSRDIRWSYGTVGPFSLPKQVDGARTKPPFGWKDIGGIHASFAEGKRMRGDLLDLCDVTQQIYLEMKPWQEWIVEGWERRRRRKSQPTTPVSTSEEKAVRNELSQGRVDT